jgi:hypothetical protein
VGGDAGGTLSFRKKKGFPQTPSERKPLREKIILDLLHGCHGGSRTKCDLVQACYRQFIFVIHRTVGAAISRPFFYARIPTASPKHPKTKSKSGRRPARFALPLCISDHRKCIKQRGSKRLSAQPTQTARQLIYPNLIWGFSEGGLGETLFF